MLRNVIKGRSQYPTGQKMKNEELLKSVYYDPSNAASFSSAKALFEAVKSKGISLSDVKKWLSTQATYTLHKPRRKTFMRNPVVVSNIDQQWQADLVDMQKLSVHNQGFKYLVTVIDIFSKYAFVFPVKSKSADELVSVFEKIFKTRQPNVLQTDQGLEFDNSKLKALLKKRRIQYFTTRNTETKCVIVERFNRTLRSRMFKYFTANGTRKYTKVLPDLVKAYNNSIHRSTGMRPSDIRDEHRKIIFKKLYGFASEREMLLAQAHKKSNLKVGEQVRIQYQNEPFQKGYYPQWTDEVFSINNVAKDNKKPQYKLKDYHGEEIEGRFYPEEVQKVSEVKYRVEKVVATRTVKGVKQVKVKWLNYPVSDNSWINKSDLEDVS